VGVLNEGRDAFEFRGCDGEAVIDGFSALAGDFDGFQPEPLMSEEVDNIDIRSFDQGTDAARDGGSLVCGFHFRAAENLIMDGGDNELIAEALERGTMAGFPESTEADDSHPKARG
jgi:hypothetical protein